MIAEIIHGLIVGYKWGRAMAGAEDDYEEAREIAEVLGPWYVCKDHDLSRTASLEEIAEAMAEGYDDEDSAAEGAMLGFETFLRGDPPAAQQGPPSTAPRPGRGWGKRGA
jgi:hypothetical protein